MTPSGRSGRANSDFTYRTASPKFFDAFGAEGALPTLVSPVLAKIYRPDDLDHGSRAKCGPNNEDTADESATGMKA
jgi:hypothetical protein